MLTPLRRINFLAALILFVLTAVRLCTPAHAAVVFDNFGPADDFQNGGRILEGPDVGSVGDVNQANFFTVGPDSQFVTSISLGLFVNDSPSIGTGLLNVVIAADAAGAPGAALRTLPIDVDSTGKQVVTVSDDGSFSLNANTNYWIVADAEESFRGSWNFNSIGDNSLTAGQTEGFPWNVRSPDLPRYAMRIEGRIPEPSTLLLAAISLLGLTCRSRCF